MKRSFNPTAAQTAMLSVLGSLISACAFFVILPIAHHKGRWTVLALFAISCAIVLLGVYISYHANTSLKSGILSEQWPKGDVDRLGSFFRSRWTVTFQVMLILAYIALIIFCLSPHHRLRLIGWAIYLPALNLLTLSGTARTQPRLTGSHHTWNNPAPIQSSHWGEH